MSSASGSATLNAKYVFRDCSPIREGGVDIREHKGIFTEWLAGKMHLLPAEILSPVDSELDMLGITKPKVIACTKPKREPMKAPLFFQMDCLPSQKW